VHSYFLCQQHGKHRKRVRQNQRGSGGAPLKKDSKSLRRKRLIIWARRIWLDLSAYLNQAQTGLLQLSNVVIPLLLSLAIGIAIYDFGFKPFWSNHHEINVWLRVILNLLVVFTGLRLMFDLFKKKKKWVRFLTIAGWAFLIFLAFFLLPAKAKADATVNQYLVLKVSLYTGIVFAFLIELSYLLQFLYRGTVSPAVLFVGSFFFLVLLGAFLLKLPNATTTRLSAVDAFFTSTSAVCVTGLIVVDTATAFTTFGKVIILLLIQAGALGIMTFAGLFAFAVTGASSLKSRLAFRDVMSGKEISNIMSFVYRVVAVTFLFEALGAISIYFSVPDAVFPRPLDKIFFSVFHSVSAFCNAGFSTLSLGLYEPVIRYNYTMQFFLAILIILGGMGFPIVFNLARYFRIKLLNLFYRITRNPKRLYFPRLLNLNSRLALVVSAFLLLTGFIAYYFFEQNNTLLDHPTTGGKLVTSFFGAVTPRTAGFNSVDMAMLSLPTIMIYLLLMWIGASPGSTGGGIKTSTFGVAVLNMISILRGKDRSEFFRSEISHHSIRRAFALIFLSLLFIGLSVFLISIKDSNKGLIEIAFESFSAFSTVGLSLGITHQLSSFSKAVLMVTMFVGRVGTVTLMVAFIRQAKQLHYRYPKEEITF
jgi:trk system potassium uptake protein